MLRWLLAIPALGAIAGWVIAALINENCPTLDYYAGTCARAKPVHATVIGFGVGVGLLIAGYALGRIFGPVTGLFRRKPRG